MHRTIIPGFVFESLYNLLKPPCYLDAESVLPEKTRSLIIRSFPSEPVCESPRLQMLSGSFPMLPGYESHGCPVPSSRCAGAGFLPSGAGCAGNFGGSSVVSGGQEGEGREGRSGQSYR